MKLKTLLSLAALILWGCLPAQEKANVDDTEVIQEPKEVATTILLGNTDTANYLPMLRGKKVGLVVNHTSQLGDKHLADALLSFGVEVTAIYAPEHGFRGNASDGETVKDGKDTQTSLPIISLYGKNKKPTAAQLEQIDIAIFDIQDVGTRFYTYISTMHYFMEACGEQGKPFIVLDRPNPNDDYIDGPILEAEHKSFVGMHPIPVVHALTVAELAQMINGEGWLANGIKCPLTVIPCRNYNHGMPYSLPIKPSPNLPNDLSIRLYPSLCFFEGTNISVGRGTPYPFQQIGAPAYANMPISFTPTPNEGSKYPPQQGKKCMGVKFTASDSIAQGKLSLGPLLHFYQNAPNQESFFLKTNFIYKLAGTSKLKKQVVDGLSEQEIKASWQDGLTAYKAMRKKYLLYPDLE